MTVARGIFVSKAAIAAAVAACFLAGCRPGPDITTGAIPGTNPGIVVGSPVGTGSGEPSIGPVEGGLTGADIGQSLSEADRATALKAEYEAFEYGRPGQPTLWQSRSGGNHGEVSVGATYEVNRLDCREYTHKVSIGGRTRVARGTACRQPDGVWRIVG